VRNLLSQVKGVPTDVKPDPMNMLTPSSKDLEKSLLEGIDKVIEDDINERWVKWGGFHPSTTNMCPRYHVYLFRGAMQQQNHNARVQRIFDNGHAMHRRMCEYFDKMGILLKEEFPLKHDDPPIEGTCDGIIEWDGPKLLELKSIGEAGFVYRRLYHKPKDEHYRQVQIYMRCLELDEAFVVYENKNTQEVLPILVQKNDEFTDKLFAKLRKTHKAYTDGKIPVRPYKQTSEKCNQCQLQAQCWSDPDEGVKL